MAKFEGANEWFCFHRINCKRGKKMYIMESDNNTFATTTTTVNWTVENKFRTMSKCLQKRCTWCRSTQNGALKCKYAITTALYSHTSHRFIWPWLQQRCFACEADSRSLSFSIKGSKFHYCKHRSIRFENLFSTVQLYNFLLLFWLLLVKCGQIYAKPHSHSIALVDILIEAKAEMCSVGHLC